MCALAQFVVAQNSSTGTLSGVKKHDVKQASFFTGGGSVVISDGKKHDCSVTSVFSDTGDPIIIGGTGKKSDFNSDTGGSGTAVGSTVGTLGKKKDFASLGEPITNPTRKKQDFSSLDSGGNGQVLGTGGIKRDYCVSGGTVVSSGSTTIGSGGTGKKSDYYNT